MVLDASLALAWCFEDEKTASTEDLLNRVVGGGLEIAAPEIFWAEVGNALLFAERQKKITAEWTGECLTMLSTLTMTLHRVPLQQAMPFARKHRLALYDASYLALAIAEGLELASLDRALRKAASRERVNILP